MEQNFKNFYDSLDVSKFKYFLRDGAVFVYNTDIDMLPCNMKPKNSRVTKVQCIEQVVKEMLTVKKIPVEEYTGYVLTKKGFPGDYLDFLDLCISDSIPPTIFAVNVESSKAAAGDVKQSLANIISVAFIKDSAIMECVFQDDDLYSHLYSLACTHNCIQFLYTNKSMERVFNSWGIECIFNKFTSCAMMIKSYMKVDLKIKQYTKDDCCIVNISDFDLVDFGCITQQGKRLLNQWIRAPCLNVNEINRRLDLSEAFVRIEINLNRFPDLKRLSSKIQNKNITSSEIIKIAEVIDNIAGLIASLQTGNNKELLNNVFIQPLQNLQSIFVPLINEIKSKINEKTARIHSRLSDELTVMEKAKFDIFQEIEYEYVRIKKEIPKVVFANRMFRISRLEYNQTNWDSKNFVVVSLQKTGAYFTTKQLTESNEKLSKLEKEIETAESKILNELKEAMFSYCSPIETFNFLIALIDVYKAFSNKVRSSMYCRPVFNDERYEIEGLFHPMLEYKDAILNDISFDKDMCVLTGPNMGGKSTFIKALSMASLYGQIGCYVPARKATLPIFDRIFLRIGARDCSSQKMSTFMVEMADLNKIIRSATSKSLVLIDELGRGTSAIDGLSLVLAVKEYLIKLKSKTVMATHFSEVGDERTLCKKMAVEGVLLTYKIIDGICDTSFGIKVAEMASFPVHVIEKAKYYLSLSDKK